MTNLSTLSDEQLNVKLVKLAKRNGWKLVDGKWWHDEFGDGPPPTVERGVVLRRLTMFTNPVDRTPRAFDGRPRKITYEEALAQTRLHHGKDEHDLQTIGREMRRLCEWFPELSLEQVKYYGYRWFWEKFGRRPIIPCA